MADYARLPLAEHVEEYLLHLKAKGCTEKHRRERKRYLISLFDDCGFKLLKHFQRSHVEKWMLRQEKLKTSARVRNAYRSSLMAFCNWAVIDGRLQSNPFEKLAVANEKIDIRRQRRPLAADELQRLIYVAELRPLADYGRKSIPIKDSQKQGRATWRKEILTFDNIKAAYQCALNVLADRPEFIEELKSRGRRNTLFYKLAAFTGLRKNELASITLKDIHLDSKVPYIEIHPENEKARRGAKLPIKSDLAQDLKIFIATKHARPNKVLSNKTKLLTPPNLKSFNLDLSAANIEKIDSRGRTADIHSLRHTFGTMLARNGVAPRTAQELMRHSKIDLTMNIYTHLELIDTAQAVESLPNICDNQSFQMSAI